MSRPQPSHSIHATSFIDPATSIRGPYPILIHANVLIHPRSTLSTESSSITIGSGANILENCRIGTISSTVSTELPKTAEIETLDKAIKIGRNVFCSSSVTIHAPCQISDNVHLEANVTVSPNCTIGSNTKICAGIDVPENSVIPANSVIYGPHGRYRRTLNGASSGNFDDNDTLQDAKVSRVAQVDMDVRMRHREYMRLKGWEVVRKGEMEILRRNALAKVVPGQTQSGHGRSVSKVP